MVDPTEADFEAILAGIARELKARELTYMLIGGHAVLLHGEPRLTQDIDLTLAADPTRLPELLAICTTLALEPLPPDVEAFVRRTFVLPVVAPETGVRIDFIFSSTPYEREAIARAQWIEIQGTPVAFASAEDLILHKIFAGRPRDLEDVAGVVRRKGESLDWGYIETWANEFAAVPGREDLPDRVARLKAGFGD